MLPGFLIPEFNAMENGAGDSIDVSSVSGRTIQITLGITRIVEQESLDVSIWGSEDGEHWGAKPVATFPQKFYCGTYSLMVNLAPCPNVRFIRVQWKMNRWGRGSLKPLFGFYVFAQPLTQMSRAAS